MSIGEEGRGLLARRRLDNTRAAAAVTTQTIRPQSHLLACCQRCGILAAVALAGLVILLAREEYNSEDSPLNGALLGTPGIIRVELHSSEPGGHSADGKVVMISNLGALIKQASSLFNADIEAIFTADGARVTELDVPSAGRSCLFDGIRCIFDSSRLFAVARGASFVRHD